eukprot:TRINITY_DN38014_c0_g1_i1.p1 TRINITY_DN38014_c0_g1~~TRINITY_DN38014_c0_g1_i1.p1  ORF type:complete len:716 (+),score=125.83 TRINITY_DN38014_c0_g1_i1:139-2148(+)
MPTGRSRRQRSCQAVHPVPNMNIYGHHDLRQPYQDKSHLFEEEINHPRWLGPSPGIRSRSELQQARIASRVPDPKTYDLDGDGAVGQKDFLAARYFDRDCDGRLTSAERKQADEAIKNGLYSKQIHGLETSTDANNLVTQKRGVVWTGDNAAEAAQAGYRPHFNASKIPAHSTKTALLLDRAAELKNLAVPFGARLAEESAMIREKSPVNAQTEPRMCSIAHIRERAEADSQAARGRAGLLPVSTHINPARETRNIGLNYVEEPFVATRSRLSEARKDMMKREGEELRAKGEELFPPPSVRNGEKEVEEHEFRRPSEGEPMTLTKLKDDRRVQKIEYDMQNFKVPQPASCRFPRFADQPEVPFWVDQLSRAAKPGTAPAAMSRVSSEPAFKVNEVTWKDQDDGRSGCDLPDGAYATLNAAGFAARGRMDASDEKTLGSHTLKRWSSDMIEHGKGRNKPRIFDDIPIARVGPRDMEPLELTSAMEPIRNAAMRKQAEERKENALNPPRSKLSRQPGKIMRVNRSVEAHNVSTSDGNSADSRRNSIADPMRPQQASRSENVRLSGISELPVRPPGEIVEIFRRPHSESGVRCGGFQRMDMDSLRRHAMELSNLGGSRMSTKNCSDGDRHQSQSRMSTKQSPGNGNVSAGLSRDNMTESNSALRSTSAPAGG